MNWNIFLSRRLTLPTCQVTGGFFHMTLSNVTILPENSCNRDIREMRANDLVLKIEEPVIRSLVREGYKVYDANGALLRTLRG